jgi:hypothetical protein
LKKKKCKLDKKMIAPDILEVELTILNLVETQDLKTKKKKTLEMKTKSSITVRSKQKVVLKKGESPYDDTQITSELLPLI